MNSVIVVEGLHDAARIRLVYKDAHIIITNGTSLSDEVLNEIIKLSKDNEIILFLDPDYPGNKIRQLIASKVDNVLHAHVKRELATNGKKVGIEHASLETIKQALHVKALINKTDITTSFLLDYGYIGHIDARQKRLDLLNYFDIGYVNGKGLLKKLSLFGITKKQVIDYESKKTVRTELLKK